MTKIYFDTEFEGLFENAGLISIGLIDDLGSKSFYAELPYDKKKCSSFCQLVVLPLLEKGEYIMTLEELREKLCNWLQNQGTNTLLICDSNRDISQLEKLFPRGIPQNCQYQSLGVLGKWKRRIFNINRRMYKKYQLRNHHALDDAKVNRLIFESYSTK